MADNVLKKDFQQRDVQRLRNLVQGKYGDKVGEGVGYTKAEEFHKEGDIWEVDGRKWTIKNGIKQNITKHKKCFNCVLDFEFKLRKAGLFEEYEKNIINSEIEGFIVNFKDYVESKLTESNNSFVTEQGDVEKWDGGLDKKRVLENLNNTIEYLEKMKK